MTNIPATLHYIWIGGQPLPDVFRANIATWRRLNPDFEIREWNEVNLDWSSRYMRAAYTFGYWSRVTNLARMQILQKHGGVYLDVDIEMRRSMQPLLENTCFLGFQDSRPNADWVNGAVIGAAPGHWFVDQCMARLLGCFSGVEVMDSRHGPGNVTQVLIDNGLAGYCEHGAMVRDVRIYPRAAFYPYHWSEAFDEARVTPETFLVHRWAASWVPHPPPETPIDASGFRERLVSACKFLHMRAQWRLLGRPRVHAFYHRAIANAAALWFSLRRRYRARGLAV
jgi:hypothetical protein